MKTETESIQIQETFLDRTGQSDPDCDSVITGNSDCTEERQDIPVFRSMRRSRQRLSGKDCHEILRRGSCGVLALYGDHGYPYALPISYVFDGEKIFFHCAKAGHKIDAIHRNVKASFCVIDQNQVVPEEYTSYFRSVIVFGRIHIIQDESAMYQAMEKLALKYAPCDYPEHRQAAIEKDWRPLCVLEMEIDHIGGKEAIELVRRKNSGIV